MLHISGCQICPSQRVCPSSQLETYLWVLCKEAENRTYPAVDSPWNHHKTWLWNSKASLQPTLRLCWLKSGLLPSGVATLFPAQATTTPFTNTRLTHGSELPLDSKVPRRLMWVVIRLQKTAGRSLPISAGREKEAVVLEKRGRTKSARQPQ